MRVLVLHQHYWPEIAATAQILSDLCEDLATAGHQVTVVCGHPSYRSLGEHPSVATSEQHRGVTVHRVWSYTPRERTIARRLAHYATFFVSSTLAALTGERPDVCLVMSTPPLLLGISGVLAHTLRGIPFVYSVQDLYPDIAVHLGIIAKDGAVARLSERVGRACYCAAANLVTLSDAMAERLAAKGVHHDRVHVIPNWSDTASVRPCPRDNDFAREHGLTDPFVVQYAGNLGLSQGLECVIGAAEQLQDLPIKFALVGDGAARSSLERAAREKRLTNVCFLPPQPRTRLAELLASCEVGLVTMTRGVGADLVPSKLYGIMAARKPVLAAVEANSEVARVLEEHACGWTVAPQSASALAEGIRVAFASTQQERSRLGTNGRRACERLYSRSVSTSRYEEVLLRSCGLAPETNSRTRRAILRTASAFMGPAARTTAR